MSDVGRLSGRCLASRLTLKVYHPLEAGVWFAVDFHPSANDQIRPDTRARLEVEVTSFCPLGTIGIQPSKPVFRLVAGGIPGRDVQGHPTETGRIEIRPASVARIMILALIFNFEAASNNQTARDALRTAECDEEGMLIGAAIPFSSAAAST